MKTYFYFPAGRRLWLDVAVKLSESEIAQPLLWLGDPVHSQLARAKFAELEIVDLETFDIDFSVPEVNYDGSLASFWHSLEFFRTKDRVIKLMDRIDPKVSLRNVDRDALFNSIVAWAINRLVSLRPNFLLFSEAPHSVAPYVMYAIAKYIGTPIFSFSSWPLFPVLSMRKDIDGPFLPSSDIDSEIVKRFDTEIDAYLARYKDPSGYSFEPRYMRQQQHRDPDAGLAQTVRRLSDGSIRALKHVKQQNRIASRIRVVLCSAMLAAQSTRIPSRYVYFPLHYEPERTTNPDGGDFHDQMRCLAILRSVIPADIGIVVKEHPSQFNHRMKGHLGRSPAFYDMIKNIAGVSLVSLELSSAELIRGAESVASVTGTVALEAAILGKPSLVFGSCWFEGCPNVQLYSHEFEYLKFSNYDFATSRDVKLWLKRALLARGLPGCVNPSNERYFAQHYTDTSLPDLEVAAISRAVASAI